MIFFCNLIMLYFGGDAACAIFTDEMLQLDAMKMKAAIK